MSEKKKTSSLLQIHTPGSRGSPAVTRMKLSSVSQTYGYLNVGDSSSDSCEEEDIFRHSRARIDFIPPSPDTA